MNQTDDTRKRDFDLSCSEEDEYYWAFDYFQTQLIIIKKCNDKFTKYLKDEDKLLDKELWKDSGIGFRNWLADVKEIKKVRGISKFKDGAIFKVNIKNPFFKAVHESMDLMHFGFLVRDMSLVFLITIFEDFLQKILTISFRKRPEALRSCQKRLTYEDLLKFGDISEVRERIIEKETAIVNEDIEIIREYVQKKFGIDISILSFEDSQKIHALALEIFEKDKPYNWVDFKERFYRRNVIIHNSGIPNKIYRQKTGYQGNNEALRVSTNYLNDSLVLFWELAFNIGLTFEEKMKDSKAETDSNNTKEEKHD